MYWYILHTCMNTHCIFGPTYNYTPVTFQVKFNKNVYYMCTHVVSSCSWATDFIVNFVLLFARVEWELINKWNKFHVTSNQIPSVLNCFDIFCFLLQWLLCESAMSQINFISQILILPVTVRVTSRCLATVNVSRRVTPRSVDIKMS